MKEIKLTQGQVALVDDEDFKRVSQYKWQANWDPDLKSFYAMRSDYSTGSKVRVFLSHFILNYQKNGMVDHKNHNTLDNQKCNLRECTSSQNSQNRKKQKGCSSCYKGVSWYSAGKTWRAFIGLRNIFGQKYVEYLGHFKIEKEAALAYDKAAHHYFGEFAYLNFPMRPTDG